jgi:hypothetical protein
MSKMEKKKSPLEEDPQVQELLKQAHKDEEKKAEIAAQFDIDDFAEETDTVKSKFVAGVGTIKWKPISMEELFEIQKTGDPSETGLRIVAFMLSKADPKVTFEKFRKLNAVLTNKIANALKDDLAFLTVTK